MLRLQENTAVKPRPASRPTRPAPAVEAPARPKGSAEAVTKRRGDIWWLIAICLLFLLGTSPAWVLMYYWVEF